MINFNPSTQRQLNAYVVSKMDRINIWNCHLNLSFSIHNRIAIVITDIYKFASTTSDDMQVLKIIFNKVYLHHSDIIHIKKICLISVNICKNE